MQLSRFTDYTLRVLFYAAIHNDRLVTLSEIANYYDISIEHLRKVVHALAKSGYLATFRGKKGGIKLAQATAEINLADIVNQSEGSQPLINCAEQTCCLTNQCSLQEVLVEAQQAFIKVLEKYTLEDLLTNPKMRTLLIARSAG
ncbi:MULTISPECIES: Rrf2 family transcriptional regulator [unclassified Neptuniibacter]|jgi:Rrf2 family nitric oxide-sensitive transcriptional repressor|uniref:RrF2 family transcriptional regulator n=1 Tax=unclassified Neptuniibacter TaxID=2630693 RepID=UPI0026E1C86F|nr:MULTISPECIES: Rrf2 family transcriptional regulator [unclassified Neptuniibacter]MDO6514340.1 Rrf2 family transcriptional regulator [Neptuniibacter sp. 2_MG-2023]MDO6594385.1 Rrf2 family transcriptional regulator [Neptuniibacter sp. 1_MG-2023]